MPGGWIISLEGDVLARTDDDLRFSCVDADFGVTRAVTSEFPRRVAE